MSLSKSIVSRRPWNGQTDGVALHHVKNSGQGQVGRTLDLNCIYHLII